MFDYQQLEALIDIEREGSFENTAHLKRVSKSAISQKSRHIDQRLGFATIGRNPSCPTIFGKSLCRHVEKIKLLESSLVVLYGDLFDTAPFDRAALRVAVDDDLPSRSLLEHLEPSIDRNIRFPYETIVAKQVHAIDQLMAQNVAAALSCKTTASKHFVSHGLGEFSFIATANPDYAKEAFSGGFCEQSVLQAKSASYDYCNDLNARFVRQLFGVNLGSPNFKVSSSYGIRNLCVDGCGWAMLPIHLVHDHLQNGQLVNLSPGQVLNVPLYWNVSSFLDELIDDFTKTIVETTQRLTSVTEPA